MITPHNVDDFNPTHHLLLPSSPSIKFHRSSEVSSHPSYPCFISVSQVSVLFFIIKLLNCMFILSLCYAAILNGCIYYPELIHLR